MWQTNGNWNIDIALSADVIKAQIQSKYTQ